ncbi:hypothetical protein CQA66_05015 [Helicobacter aurati]|uniref:Uncharacterized protein n=1 Tax=Helicobacter aurati TaxID=137778 RepID=A0A3D8J4P8_9HELI|nr:hypothetical protein [Helicobacter aurati]RDU72423.1 hypothetical protein CQA66_05015 [Helicobacter aurati]
MINFSIKNLQIQGYTVLIKGENKKSGIFFLTELGQEFVRKNITQLFVLENNVFNEFSPEESKQLTQLLKKIPFAFSQKSAAEFCNPKILRTAKGK